MIPKRVYSVSLLFFLLIGCFHQGTIHKDPLEEKGNCIIYLQPLQQEAFNLRFTIDTVIAVRDDGNQIPLSLSSHEVNGEHFFGIQKRFASGYIPPGTYNGITITVKKASLVAEDGEANLLIPEKPLVVSQSFSATERKVLTLFLSFEASEAITSGVRFTPVFSLVPSSRVLTNFIGYVSNSDSNFITVFNKKTMQVVGAISTGRGPTGIALDQKRGRAYIAASEDNAIEIIDVFEWEIIGRITLNFGDTPIDLALTPDGRTLVAVNHSSNTVSVIDTLSMFETGRIKVGDRPTSASIDPKGFKAYVTNTLSNSISVIDLNGNRLSATIAIDGSPIRSAFNLTGDNLYVICRNSPHLSVVDPLQSRLARKIYVGMEGVSVSTDKQTGIVLVGKRFGGEISVIEPIASMYIDSIGVEGIPAFMSIDKEENTLFVVLPDKKTLQKINLTSKKNIAEIEVGEGAYAVAVMGER